MSSSEDLNKTVRKFALVNATEHDGKASVKSVLGKILSEYPKLRKNVQQVRSAVELEVEKVNRMKKRGQKKKLEKLGGYTKTKKEEEKGLPELELGREKFVVRFAPNPNGALHLGNARPAVLSDEYAKRYKGRFILRFDDTDPKIKIPEKKFYKWAREDLKWLGVRVHKEVTASKRLSKYYKHAETLIKDGNAYVCTCEPKKWKKLRDSARACPCRSKSPKDSMKRWRKMKRHTFREGDAVLRIKTETDAKNPAVRDWPAARIVDDPEHPLAKKHLWPLYNFASAIDDHLLGVTHIFRGQEHSTNESKQRYLYMHMGWDYPVVVTLGRFSMSDMVLSKSRIRRGIENRKYRGWDDPKLGTLRTLRRRGFHPEALRNLIIDIGPKPNDVTVSFENLAAYNRKVVDATADRYFFISDPKKIRVKNMRIKSARLPAHPSKKKKTRSFKLSDTFYIDADDYADYKELEIRLKDLCNIKLGRTSRYVSKDVKNIPKIQWVTDNHINVRVETPTGTIKGYGEQNIKKAKVGEVVQFERFGFVRIEKKSASTVFTVFGHE